MRLHACEGQLSHILFLIGIVAFFDVFLRTDLFLTSPIKLRIKIKELCVVDEQRSTKGQRLRGTPHLTH